MYDILVYGPLFCDLVFTGLPEMPSLGVELFASDLTIAIGGSAIVAVGLRRLEARVGLIAELGNDPLSAVARQLLDAEGLERALLREHPHPLPQITVALSFPQDRAFVTRFQRPETPPDLAALLREHPAKHLHICSFLAAFDLPDAARAAHEAGLTVSLDPGWDKTALRDRRLRDMIAEVDIFMPSESELRFIAQEDDVAEAARRLMPARAGALVIVKQGADGATLYRKDTPPLHVPAIPVTPVDTTGAGDSFDAGFLDAFVRGDSLALCMQIGSICGGLATTAPGGTTALPSRTEVETWLSKLRS
ncbi:MAG: carbohydrate kinase family protein [Anaerolineaceae bacterium]|nr:carbohydrate kinase family protein [Anaerolineaceae bacterium]